MLSDLVHNEQTKLTATYFNTIASASVVVGVVTPIVAAVYGLTTGSHPSLAFVFGGPIWLCASIILHYQARRILKRLR